jgi:hypothetical protein
MVPAVNAGPHSTRRLSATRSGQAFECGCSLARTASAQDDIRFFGTICDGSSGKCRSPFDCGCSLARTTSAQDDIRFFGTICDGSKSNRRSADCRESYTSLKQGTDGWGDGLVELVHIDGWLAWGSLVYFDSLEEAPFF